MTSTVAFCARAGEGAAARVVVMTARRIEIKGGESEITSTVAPVSDGLAEDVSAIVVVPVAAE
jgi:hypothetical protein